MRISPSAVRDALGAAGLLVLTAGVGLEFGPGWAGIIAGAILLVLAVTTAAQR